jgi:hypothetical protein
MELNDIHTIITSTEPGDWSKIASGPSYRDWFRMIDVPEADGEMASRIHVDSHHTVAVYRGDVNLSIAWGLDHDVEEPPDVPGPRRSFSWQSHFPDEEVYLRFADVFWVGSLVSRHLQVVVDGGRGLLPMPQHVVSKRASDQQPMEWEDRVSQLDVDFARLIHGFMYQEDLFEHYLAQAGWRVLPGGPSEAW